MELKDFPYSELDVTQMAKVEAAFAEEIASACDVNNKSVVDLFGKATSVTISPDGKVSAFVKEVTGHSANELAARLYSSSFREELVNSTLTIFGSREESFNVGAIAVKPEAFTPLVPTSTATTTTLLSTTTIPTTATATATTTVAVTTTAAHTTRPHESDGADQHKDRKPDEPPSPDSDAEPTSMATIQAAAWPWPLLLCLYLVVGSVAQQC